MKIVLGQKTVPIPGENPEPILIVERGHDLAAMGSLGPSPATRSPENPGVVFEKLSTPPRPWPVKSIRNLKRPRPLPPARSKREFENR